MIRSMKYRIFLNLKEKFFRTLKLKKKKMKMRVFLNRKTYIRYFLFKKKL